MTDAELRKWLREDHRIMEKYEARDVVDALVALLREATEMLDGCNDMIKAQGVRPAPYLGALVARLRAVLGEGR